MKKSRIYSADCQQTPILADTLKKSWFQLFSSFWNFYDPGTIKSEGVAIKKSNQLLKTWQSAVGVDFDSTVILQTKNVGICPKKRQSCF